MQIFAYTENSEFRTLLEIEVKEATGSRPVVQTTLEELISMVEIFHIIDVLIVDLSVKSPRSESLKNFLQNSSDSIKKIFVIGEEDIQGPHIKCYKLQEIFKFFEEIKDKKNVHETYSWTRVPLSTLIHFEFVPFDLYIRLSENKYIKRIPAFEKVDRETIQLLESKNILNFYCEKKYKRDFSMLLINHMINKLERKYPVIDVEMKAEEEVFETVKQIIQSLGISGRVIEVCETAIQKMCGDVLKDANEFSAYLQHLLSEKSLSYQYRLIALTNYIGTQLIIDMQLPNGDEQIRNFIYASYFCDMKLMTPQFRSHLSTEDMKKLSLEEHGQVNFHALQAAHLFATYKNGPEDVCLIIQQHHGSFSGIGIPKEKSNKLLPLSKILIVSQELASAILNHEKTPVLEILKKFLAENRCTGLQELLDILENRIGAYQ